MRSNVGLIAGAGVVVAVGIGAAALTANNTIDDTNAGQGLSVTSGYTVDNIDYTTDVANDNNIENVRVTDIGFDIVRDNPPGQGDANVADANAEVWLQVRGGDPFSRNNWTQCVATAGRAECDLDDNGSSILLSDITEISVAAYDLTPQP